MCGVVCAPSGIPRQRERLAQEGARLAPDLAAVVAPREEQARGLASERLVRVGLESDDGGVVPADRRVGRGKAGRSNVAGLAEGLPVSSDDARDVVVLGACAGEHRRRIATEVSEEELGLTGLIQTHGRISHAARQRKDWIEQRPLGTRRAVAPERWEREQCRKQHVLHGRGTAAAAAATLARRQSAALTFLAADFGGPACPGPGSVRRRGRVWQRGWRAADFGVTRRRE